MLSVSRQEIKYVMKLSECVRLQSELEKVLFPDKYSEEGYYMVRSLYFDSVNGVDYAEKYDGVENRKKIRLRIYDTAQDNAKFEIKKKFGAYQRKDSLLISRKDAESIISGDHYVLLEHPEKEAAEIYSIMTLGAYRPAAIIEYDRRAMFFPEFSTRITIDRNIRTSEFYYDLWDDRLPLVPQFDDMAVLEVKFNGSLIEPVKAVIAKYDLTRVSCSKYAMCRPQMQNFIM